MKFAERSSLNKILLLLYLTFTILAPLSVVLFSVSGADNSFNDSRFLSGAFNIMFFFIGLPVFITYMVKITNYRFPLKNKSAILMILSFVIFLIYTIIFYPDELFESLERGGLIFYIALNIIFFIGLFGRVFFENKKIRILGKIMAFMVVILIFFYPPAYLLAYLIDISVNNSDDYIGILELVLSLLLIFGMHLPLLRKMEKLGEL